MKKLILGMGASAVVAFMIGTAPTAEARDRHVSFSFNVEVPAYAGVRYYPPPVYYYPPEPPVVVYHHHHHYKHRKHDDHWRHDDDRWRHYKQYERVHAEPHYHGGQICHVRHGRYKDYDD